MFGSKVGDARLSGNFETGFCERSVANSFRLRIAYLKKRFLSKALMIAKVLCQGFAHCDRDSSGGTARVG